MNNNFKIIKKIFLYFFYFLIFSFFVYWFKVFKEGDHKLRDKEGFERIIVSFGLSLLYYLLGLIATVTGILSNPFNFFLHIYGFENEDFIRIDPRANGRDPSLDN